MLEKVATEISQSTRSLESKTLSPRQAECLTGVLQLKSAKQIGRDLGISPHAVEKHLKASRLKFGVGTSADAARLFARSHEGGEFPQCHFSEVATAEVQGHPKAVFDLLGDDQGASLPSQSLTPRQTLLTIFAVSFGSIVGLLLLVACAEGIRSLIGR
jgi:DNA-binding CsgD family transcriptional regulator